MARGPGGPMIRGREAMGAVPVVRTSADPEGGEGVSVEELVVRSRNGDTRAFEQVYRRMVGRVYALCLRMTADPRRAEELTQDVFVRAWERLDSFRGESRFSTWLHRLAVNVVIQERRTEGRRGGREQPMGDPELLVAEARRAMPGTRIDLERAIAGLPAGAREMLVLRDIEGYRYQEMADLRGVALGTVKAQIHRARKLLREALER
jgi:RNA polymerase sigma-70 factor, ECF subfamily